MTAAVFEDAANLLAGCSDYRVLRRFTPVMRYHPYGAIEPARVLKGAYVDVETTGVDTERDEIIQFAAVLFEFDAEGHIYAVDAPITYLEQPTVPIPAEVTALTGLTDNMVALHRIDDEAVARALEAVELVVAHHADFDRRFLERRLPIFASHRWGCSHMDVPWAAFGTTSGKLVHILQDTCGQFYDAHGADRDCQVGVHVLATARFDGRPALAHLLDAVRKPTVRIWIGKDTFAINPVLKARGYQWSDGTRGRPKSWYIDVTPEALDGECTWLARTANITNPRLTKITARERYSVRADRAV